MAGIMQMVANNVQPAVSVPIQLLYLDPGNSSSYSGSGTTWNDLSGNNNTATLNGGPTWTDAGAASYFTFNGTGTQNATTASAKYVQTYTGKTVMMAIRPSASAWTNGLDQFRGIFGTAAGSRNFNTYIHHDSSNNLQIHYSANGTGGFSNNISLPSNQWSIIAVTQTTSGLVTYYLNGQAVGTNTGITFAQYANSGNTENVAFTDNYWYGDVGVTAVYGSALTADEIQQNYNALILRFGISFTTVGTTTWTAPAGVTQVEYLVVAGGGGAGNGYDNAGGGGGGAGMVLTGNVAVTPGQSYTVTVGAGGAGGADTRTNNPGAAGNNSVFASITALGGGQGLGSRTGGAVGAAQISDTTAATGGSGSGGGLGGKGGGGATGAGSANSGATGGSGGAGISSSITGSSITYGVGGAGGGAGAPTTDGANGTANSGNGGQGGKSNSADSAKGGDGGSGIVVIRDGS